MYHVFAFEFIYLIDPSFDLNFSLLGQSWARIGPELLKIGPELTCWGQRVWLKVGLRARNNLPFCSRKSEDLRVLTEEPSTPFGPLKNMHERIAAE